MMTEVFIACFSYCSRAGSIQHLHRGLQQRDMAMRRRKPMKPAAVGQQVAVSRLKQWPRCSAAFTTAVAVTALGLMFARTVSRASWKERLGNISIVNQAQQERGKGITQEGQTSVAPVYGASVVAEYKHDLHAFTQGLLWHNDELYESTGLRGRSSVRRVNLETGEVQSSVNLLEDDFGEGLCLLGSEGQKLIQVLWKSGKGYMYDRQSLKQLSSFTFEGDAWGLATVEGENEVFLSDGSSRIRVYRVLNEDFVQLREFTVYDGARPVGLLNELEMINGELWANVWYSDFVARIDITTGLVKSWVDLRQILDKADIPADHSIDVLNGIAHDSKTGRIFVTGKLWPKLFSIRVTGRIANDIATLGNPFFLDPQQVQYIHENLLV